MNFLAHAYLSGENKKILVGNFIGDFVKGRQALHGYDPAIVTGITLHRLIDTYTDAHAVVKESKNRLRPKYRHYSAVIVDVFYDHFLAKNWNKFHHQPLVVFADNVYSTIMEHSEIIPPEVNHMLSYMIPGNWLVHYAEPEGIARALHGMSRRTAYDSRMEEAITDLRKHFHLFEKEFMEFFPLLRIQCGKFLEKHAPDQAGHEPF